MGFWVRKYWGVKEKLGTLFGGEGRFGPKRKLAPPGFKKGFTGEFFHLEGSVLGEGIIFPSHLGFIGTHLGFQVGNLVWKGGFTKFPKGKDLRDGAFSGTLIFRVAYFF